MMNRKIDEIDSILNDLFLSVQYNQDYLDDRGRSVYHYLIKRNVDSKDRKFCFNDVFDIGRNVNGDYFSRWIRHFRRVLNISAFCSRDWPYFCQFINRVHDGPDNSIIKLYIPLDREHIYEGATSIFEYLAKNNIRHQSKISSELRFDDIVVRVFNKEDAYKVQDFINNSSYIQEGLIRPNAFCFSHNGVSYAYDGELSYNSIVSRLITHYVNGAVKDGKKSVSCDDFCDYVQEYLKDHAKLFRILDDGERYSDFDAYMIVKLLLLSMRSNQIEDFYRFYDYVSSKRARDDFVSYKYPSKVKNDDFVDKRKLFDEVIITMMMKYPLGSDVKDSRISGFHYIFSYLKGNNNAITRDNNLRDRVRNGLSSDDIREIVLSSGVTGKSFQEKLYRYINTVIFKDITNSMEFAHPGTVGEYVRGYMKTNRSSYITRYGGARILSRNLNSNDIQNVFVDLGVLDIDDYINTYMKDSNSRGR